MYWRLICQQGKIGQRSKVLGGPAVIPETLYGSIIFPGMLAEFAGIFSTDHCIMEYNKHRKPGGDCIHLYRISSGESLWPPGPHWNPDTYGRSAGGISGPWPPYHSGDRHWPVSTWHRECPVIVVLFLAGGLIS